MTPQEPAIGIVDHSDNWEKATSLDIVCCCSDPDHSVTVDIARNDAEDDIEVIFYITTDFDVNQVDNWWKRLKVAASVLFKGRYQQTHSVLLNPQGALNVSHALKSRVEEFQDTTG